MPTISLNRDALERHLSNVATLDELEDIAFSYGLEYDGTDVVDGQEVVKYEIPANRYDLLCLEGFTRAIKAYCGHFKPIVYTLDPPIPRLSVEVSPEVTALRPYIVCAILRNVTLDTTSFKSLIDFQEKLHLNFCRKRTLAAIGVHNLDAITPPLRYCMQAPDAVVFAPLTDPYKVSCARDLLNEYQLNHLKPYANILKGQDLYPVVLDAQGVVSLPPVINSARTQVSIASKNLFIEVTCTSLNRGQVVLDQLVGCFSQYCGKPFHVEPVDIVYNDCTSAQLKDGLSSSKSAGKSGITGAGKESVQGLDGAAAAASRVDGKGEGRVASITTPRVDCRIIRANVSEIKVVTGIEELTPGKICQLLERMMILARPVTNDVNCDSQEIEASIPITRADVQHACDLAEDVAIAYNYNNIVPHKFRRGKLSTTSRVMFKLRFTMTSCGYRETLTCMVDSVKSCHDNLRKGLNNSFGADVNNLKPVFIRNSKIPELELVRTSLIPGMLKSIYSRKSAPLPICLYEVGHIVHVCDANDTGVASKVNFCAAYCDTRAGLEDVHGILELLMNQFGFYSDYQRWECDLKKVALPRGYKYEYKLVPCKDTTFLEGRAVEIKYGNSTIGKMGIVHPLVLHQHHISTPVSLFELNVDLLNYGGGSKPVSTL